MTEWIQLISSKNIVLIVSIAALVAFVFCAIDVWFSQRKQWNKGKCPKCSSKWKLIHETPSRRVYECPNKHCKNTFTATTMADK